MYLCLPCEEDSGIFISNKSAYARVHHVDHVERPCFLDVEGILGGLVGRAVGAHLSLEWASNIGGSPFFPVASLSSRLYVKYFLSIKKKRPAI